MRKLLLLLPLFALVLHAQTPTPAGVQIAQAGATLSNGINWLSQTTNIANTFIDAYAGVLMPFAFWELAIIAVWRFGMIFVQAGLASFNRWYFPTEAVGEIWWLLTQIIVLSAILNAYNNPSGGISLHQIPTVFGIAIAKVFDQTTVNAFMAYLQYTVANVEKPSDWYDVIGIFIYLNVLIQMGLVQLACFILNSFSYFMIALLTVFGPPLIPLLLTKKLAAWFWNWFDEMWALSMLRAFAAGLTCLWAGIYMLFFQNVVAGQYTLYQFEILLPMMLMLNISFLWGMLRLPSFSARIFNGAGAAGQSFVDGMKSAVFALASGA